MSTINELYLEIEELKKKIEEEPRKRLKRKLMIEDKIKQLEEEKRRSGLHGDFASVQQFNTQIKKLKNESAGGQAYEYESNLKVSKHKLLDILIDYYNKGHDIEDIFQIEDVSQNIQEDLLNKCNFGKATGFLFVDEIDDENYNWRYYNPIYDIEYKSRTLDDLEYQIKSHDEVFLIFDNTLADESRNRDLELYQTKIDEYLSDLRDCEDVEDIFENLKEYKDKFSKKQIMTTYEFLLEDTIDYELMVDFDEILKANLDKIDVDTQNKIYHDIIDIGINRLNDPEKYNPDSYTQTYFIRDIFDCLKKLSKQFGEKQIIGLYNFLTEKSGNYDYFYDIDYILDDYEDKTFLNKIYHDIIDDGIAKVSDSDYYYLNDIFKCLKECSAYFSKSQIIKLYNALDDFKYFSDFNSILNKNKDKFDENELNNLYAEIIDKEISQMENPEHSPYYQIFYSFDLLSDKFSKDQIKRVYDCTLENIKYSDEFNTILLDNSDKFSQEELDEIYCGLIDNGIEKLQTHNIDQNEISDIFDYLNHYSFKFSSKQVHRLCDITINDIYGFNEGFISILKDNGDDFEDVYKKIINQRINSLKDMDSQNTASKYLIKDLRYLADKFNKTQLNKLTKTIISNPNICPFAKDFMHILKANDEEKDATYEKIIDSRIKSLNKDESMNYSCLFADLKAYANKFNKNQINNFYNMIQDEKYMSCCSEDIIQILSKNKDNLDDDYQEIITEMRITAKLNTLNNISFSSHGTSGYRTARLILEDLDDYADNFTVSQLVQLCNISITNSQVYNCDYCKTSLERILSANKDRINSELYEKVVLTNGL